MNIKRIETYATKLVTLVTVVSEDGACGWGQTSTYNADITASVLHRQVAPHALGKPEDDFDGLCTRTIHRNLKFPWSYVCRALTGVETAMWDLKGKREEKSVCRLMGGSKETVPVYGSSMRRDITPKDEVERLSRLRHEKGFRAFKVRAGAEVGEDADQWPGRTKELAAAMRNAFPDDVCLLIDGNSAYTPSKAIAVGTMLQDNGFCHFEEPCPYWELEWTAEVAAALGMDVAGGEQDNDLAQWKRMIGMHAVDIVQPDVCYIGGITRTLEVARMAADRNMRCIPHSANLSMVTLFTIHVLGAIPNAGPYLEYSIEPAPWTREFYNPVPEVHDGVVDVPEGPGWGVDISKDWLQNTQFQASDL
ncbi:MAG: mandelate racemase/muconate lactonizing enzyme family protein [Chitinivibrionales bacterium]|nr:mandelate racemase/muconate lactonizing enzyme family protein [Chitinivibrionales bacterium]MBD3394837.1 mandelate racemase/muconate lactonizing enzyme family protein [Chitinivibrionales bacterium]